MEFSADLVWSDSVFSSVVKLSSRSKLKSWSRVGFEICSNFSRFANASWFPQKICCLGAGVHVAWFAVEFVVTVVSSIIFQ